MKINEVTQQRILLSVLNWGFGHVARSIGIIQQLIAQENTIFIACDADQKSVFQSYLPETVTYVDHAPYPFDFKGRGNFGEDLFDNRRKLMKRFSHEQKEVEVYVDTLKIDLIISDHRYGFFTQKCPSIFLTHQLQLPLKCYQQPMQWIHKSMIQHNFSSRWILDDAQHSLAGKLSDPSKFTQTEMLGYFSRFAPQELPSENNIPFLAILSGPKIYAAQLLKEITEFAQRTSQHIVCISSHAFLQEEHPFITLNITSDWRAIDAMILQAEVLISRTGYTTLMDLTQLNKRAILIPTKGQAEQIYLGKLHADHPKWTMVSNLKKLQLADIK